MGLFSFSKTSKQPPEYYLAQRDGLRLRIYVGMCGFKIYTESEELRATTHKNLSLSTWITLEDEWRGQEVLDYPGVEPMPKKYKESSLVCTRAILEMATEKGDPEAPFYLAMIWKYGVQLLKGIPQIDEEKASAYLYMARERGSAMEKAYQYLKEHSDKAEYDEDDHLAERMGLFGADFFDNDFDPLRSILNHDTAVYFGRLGVLLMAVCANRHMPKCSVVFGQLLVISARENHSEEERSYLEKIFEQYIIMPDAQERVRCGDRLIEQAIDKAARGDAVAVRALNQYNIKY